MTVTVAVPLLPSLVAVIVAAPAVTPVTTPAPLTVATPPLLDAQLTVRPLSALPAESRGVAVSCTVLPAATLTAAGLRTTDATGAGTLPLTAVLPLAVFDSGPNTAFTRSVPRYATNWKL